MDFKLESLKLLEGEITYEKYQGYLAIALAVTLLGASLEGLAAANVNDSSSYILKPEAREEIVSFVNEAKDFVLAEGKDKALQAFNDPNGKFVRGELYIIAYDFKGNTLALPFQPELIGTNRYKLQDPNGVYLVQAFLDAARIGSGFVYYIYPDPAANMTPKLKLCYSTKVNDEWALASGIYWPEAQS